MRKWERQRDMEREMRERWSERERERDTEREMKWVWERESWRRWENYYFHGSEILELLCTYSVHLLFFKYIISPFLSHYLSISFSLYLSLSLSFTLSLLLYKYEYKHFFFISKHTSNSTLFFNFFFLKDVKSSHCSFILFLI